MWPQLFNIWRPQVYQGRRKKGDYFEGWFFKVVSADQKHVFAFIPGIYRSKQGNDTHAFIQVLDGQRHQSNYLKFPACEFFASTKELDVRIGANRFRSDYLSVDLVTEQGTMKGQISFQSLRPWPVTLFAPGAMGWYAFVPFMQCYHGVVSLDHGLQGSLRMGEEVISFDGGRGYIEKDWGRSFPDAYVWLQSNHFDRSGLALMASVANIPWLRGSFRGFIIGFQFAERWYRFTTYTGAELRSLTIDDARVRIEVIDAHYRLVITAARQEGGLLHGPYKSGMLHRVAESLRSEVFIQFYRRQKFAEPLIYAGTGRPAGLDVNGDLARIIHPSG